MSVTKVTDDNIVNIAASKLTGALPAIDGSNLTGIVSGPTVSASNPTITTNATLGTQWANSTSGEFFILTDATTDSNVWTNVGAGTGDVQSYTFQGTSYGYASGGYQYPSPGPINVIDKYSYASDADATDVGDLTQVSYGATGQKSSTHGYVSGGRNGGTYYNTIEKFPFSTDSDGTDIGDITLARTSLTGQSSSTHGYTSGGYTGSFTNIIDRFTFSADADATDVGDLVGSTFNAGAQSSTTHGYCTSDDTSRPFVNAIQKFSFAASANATNIGNLSGTTTLPGGTSSTTHGYTMGGHVSINIIDKFSFTTDGNATDVGDLTVGRYLPAGTQH